MRLPLTGSLCVLILGFTSYVSAAPPVKEDQLSGVTQNWDKKLPSSARFTVLADFNNEAVRDNETGLVWERSPSSNQVNWDNATETCVTNKIVGGRRGWRAPSIIELTSLVDPSVAPPGPTLPMGHPFTNIQSAYYWT